MSIAMQSFPVSAHTAAYAKATKSKTAPETSAHFAVQTAANMKKATEEDELTVFKKDFYQDLAKINVHSTVQNVAINISDKAFEKMKADPEYREKVLALLQRDLCSSYAPRAASVMLTVGETLEQYRGDSWPTGSDSEFFGRSQKSFYKKTRNADEDDKEKKCLAAYEKMLWERYCFEQKYQLT